MPATPLLCKFLLMVLTADGATSVTGARAVTCKILSHACLTISWRQHAPAPNVTMHQQQQHYTTIPASTHLSMEVAHSQHLEGCAGVYTVDGYCYTVRVAAGSVVAADATRLAEQVLGNLLIELQAKQLTHGGERQAWGAQEVRKGMATTGMAARLQQRTPPACQPQAQPSANACFWFSSRRDAPGGGAVSVAGLDCCRCMSHMKHCR